MMPIVANTEVICSNCSRVARSTVIKEILSDHIHKAYAY